MVAVVGVVGAGRITNGRSPGLHQPVLLRARRSISESVLSRFDSLDQPRVLRLQHLELRASLVGLVALVEERARRIHEREQQPDEHHEEQRQTHRRPAPLADAASPRASQPSPSGAASDPVGTAARQPSLPPARAGSAAAPRYDATGPSSSSMRRSWLYLATRSLRAGAPVLI